jgi:hypothetical protein
MALAPPAATTTNAARKEIIRSVLDEITVLARGHSELVDLTLTWAGGQTGPTNPRTARRRQAGVSPASAGRASDIETSTMTRSRSSTLWVICRSSTEQAVADCARCAPAGTAPR